MNCLTQKWQKSGTIRLASVYSKIAYCVVHNRIILFGQIPTVDVTRILTGLTGLQQFSCIWGQVNR